MCKQPKHCWWKHLLGLCQHHKEVMDIQAKIVEARTETNKEFKKFNRELALMIKDENMKITLQNIKGAATDEL